MSSAPAHNSFERLAPPLQRWLWEQGWSGLRDAQLAALPLILDGRGDVVISAATAAGKTEAAFLPLLRAWTKRTRYAGVWGSRLMARRKFDRGKAVFRRLRRFSPMNHGVVDHYRSPFCGSDALKNLGKPLFNQR